MVSTVRFDRLPTQGIVYGFDKAAFVTLLIATGVGVTGTLSSGLWGLLVTAVAWAPLVVLAVVRIASEPLVTHVLREVSGMFRKSVGATTYRRRVEKVKTTPVSAVDIPGRQGRIHLFETDSGAVVVWDAVLQTVTISAVVATPGLGAPGYGAPSTLSVDEREALIDAWAKVLGSWTLKSHIERIVVIESSRPGNVAAERIYSESAMASAPETVTESYEDALSGAAAAAVAHVTKLCVTFRIRDSAKSVSKSHGGGLAGMVAAAAAEISYTTEALFHAGFTTLRWETAREWGAWARVLIDPAAGEMIDARIGGVWAGVDPQEATPMVITDHRTFVETDSGFHRSWWIGEWPRYETYPGFLSRLVFAKNQDGQPVRHTFALVASPIGAGSAMKELEKQKRTWITNDELRHKAGKPRSAADDADWLAIEAHEAELVAGQGELRFSAFISTTALEQGLLEQASGSIATACSSAGLEPRLIVWQQAEALMNVAYPCGLGMK